MAAGKVLGTSTLERFTLARRRLPEHESIFREASETVRILLWQQARIGIGQGTSGSELPPALLSRHDRHVLKSGFRSILRLLRIHRQHVLAAHAVTGSSLAERYRARFDTTWTGETPIEQVRFVVLDSETTGLDRRTDRIITIGAVAVLCARNRPRGLLRRADRSGREHERRDRARHYSRRGPRGIDGGGSAGPLSRLRQGRRDSSDTTSGTTSECSTRGNERGWGFRTLNRSLDTMDLTLHLERDGAFAGRPPIRSFTLDGLCDLFGVIPHDRHTASGDAFLTAQVFLRLLKLAVRHGRTTLAQIGEAFVDQTDLQPGK
jgi:DNA polymerase-3 subunit epsilon